MAFPNQAQLPKEVRKFERRAPGKRIPRTHPKPYQSLLWKHLETIRVLRRKHQTWAAIALQLKESHGVETTATTVFKFFKRAATARVPIGFAHSISTVIPSKPSANTSDPIATFTSALARLRPNPEPNKDPLLVEISANDPFANLKRKYEQTRRIKQ